MITLLAIFILTAGLERTGVTRQIGDLLVRIAGTSEQRLVVVVMLAAALLSLFMNNIAAAAVLLPPVSGAAQRVGVNPARLLMPLAFGTILGVPPAPSRHPDGLKRGILAGISRPR